jgi:hypothetical protein
MYSTENRVVLRAYVSEWRGLAANDTSSTLLTPPTPHSGPLDRVVILYIYIYTSYTSYTKGYIFTQTTQNPIETDLNPLYYFLEPQ